MKKHLFKPFLWGILTLSTLSSCRTEDNLNQQKQEKDMRFAVFIPQSGKTVNYADGFAHLMKRYDSIHKTNLSGMNNAPVISHLNASIDKNNLSSQSGETFVAFNIRSQTVTEENGNKWVVFPEVTNGKIVNLVVGFLSEKETKVHYYLASKESELYKNNISLFQSSLERYMKRINKLNLNASINPVSYVKETEIEEVVITVPKKNLDPRESFGGMNPAYNSGGGSCSDYGGCINDYYAPGGGGGGGTSAHAQQDPCSKAKAPAEKATNDYKNPAVQDAKKAVQDGYNSDPTGNKSEYTTMINEEGGKLEKGTTYGGYNSSNVQGGVISTTVADIHNHNDEFPPSPGDVYGVMKAFNYYQKFRTRYVYTQGGEEYAIVVTDPAALQNFYQTFPPNVTQGETRIYTNFPGNLFNEWAEIVQQYGNNLLGNEIALAQILNKYNAGVAVTKKDKTTGDFKKLNVTENSDGKKTITNCN